MRATLTLNCLSLGLPLSSPESKDKAWKTLCGKPYFESIL